MGIQDNSTRQRLLSEKELSLQKCVEIACSYEATEIRLKTMRENHGEKGSVERVRKFYKKGNRSNKGQDQSTFDNTSEQKGFSKFKKCYFGGRDFHKRQFYPAKNATFNVCTKKGHFQEVCKSSKPVREVLIDEQSSSSDQETSFGRNINIDKQWSVKVPRQY